LQFGTVLHRHVQPRLLFGYHQLDIRDGQPAFAATSEKNALKR